MVIAILSYRRLEGHSLERVWYIASCYHSHPTRGGTAEPVSRDQILRHVRGQGNIYFPCSAETTSRIGNLTRSIHTPPCVMTIHIPVSRDQILRHVRGQGNIHFPCSADHEQDWQPYPVDPYPAICDDHTHTYIPPGSQLLIVRIYIG